MSARVLHVSQPVDAGVAVVVADLAADQLERGWQVAVAAPDHGPLPGWLAERGVEHLAWPAGRGPGFRSVGEIRRIRAIVRGFQPALVHLHASTAGLAGRAALRGRVPTVFQPHSWSFDASQGAMRRAVVAWERWAARWTDAYVCVSDAERRAGAAAGLRGRFEVIANGVDLDAYSGASASDRLEARASLGLPDAPLAVVIGRLAPQKGQDVALAAWPAVRERVPEAMLVLVGDGPERARLEAALPEGVWLAGDRPDVPAWLRAADLVVAPSRWEGMSLAVLEAMATGRSIVASDVAGMREALGETSGAIVPAGDPGALAVEVAARLADPGSSGEEGRAARRRAEERFDVRRTRADVVALYERLLGQPEAAE